jgi:nucleoid-associated protein YgaU
VSLSEAETTRFSAPLWRWPTPNGVMMVTVPAEARPPVLAAFGRTPIVATVLGRTWNTSIFASRQYGAILLMPKKVIGKAGEGVAVEVSFVVDRARLLDLG